MTRVLFSVALVASCGAFWLAGEAASDLPARVDSGGHPLRMRVEGSGSPAVVFEIGLGGALEEWAAVQPEVAKFTRVVAYDRIGSNHDEPRLTGREIACELRQALRAAGVEPPFVLVGQSFGAIYNRVFASLFPDEVAGLVLLDPSQEEFIEWMAIHHPDRQLSASDVVGWPEGAGIWETLEQLESLGTLPNVPTVLITGARPGDDPFRRKILPRWIKSHADWINALPQGRHILAPDSGHGVHVEAPELVVETIRQLVDTARNAVDDASAKHRLNGRPL